jgi:hypothetical protein
MKEIQRLIDNMDPQEAVAEMAIVLRRILPILDDDTRTAFVMNLMGDAPGDNVSSMVHR